MFEKSVSVSQNELNLFADGNDEARLTSAIWKHVICRYVIV